MPLKLNVGLTKKIGQPHYGSLGSSCHVEIELDSSLLQSDAEAFYERARQTFAACRRAVETELALGDQRRRCAAPATSETVEPLPAIQAAADNDQRADGEETEDAGAENGEAELLPASASQLNYVRRLASRIGRAAALRVEVLAQHRFGKPLTDLSRDEATHLILTLRAVKAGELDWETVLDESAA